MKLMLIDGNSVLNRAFYGVPPLTNSKGFHTNAIYGFLNILLRHMEEDCPDLIYVAFDVKAKNYRHELYSDYKAGRKGMPEELAEQLPVLKEVIDALGLVRAECAGLEADDIIGIISKAATEKGDSVIIVTGDRDELQLINDNITVKLAVTKVTGSGDSVFDVKAVYDKYGLAPHQLVDLKALMGDTSDNIPGVAGIGEKTAVALLKEYETLENVYEKVESVKPAVRNKLIAGKDDAFMSRELGRIRRDLPEEMILPPLEPLTEDRKKLSELLSELEMTSLLDKLDLKTEMKSAEAEIVTEDFNEDIHGDILKRDVLYVIDDSENSFVYIKGNESALRLSYDDLHFINGKKIVTHDAKPLMRHMKFKGLTFGLLFDTAIASYVLNPSKSTYFIETVYTEILGRALSEPAQQVFALDELHSCIEERLKENGSYELFSSIELPLCSVLADAEVSGVELDTAFLSEFGEKVDEQVKELTDVIYEFAGGEFNINSPKQLAKVLFEDLLLPPSRKTKTGYSTDNEVLEELTAYSPIAEYIITYRQLTKLKSTYVDALLKAVADDGRVHTVYTQTVTQTGRISSIEPNLQNVPVRTPLGRELRKAFRAKDGCVLIDADYSQIELRILAHIADDENMQNIFASGEDIHTRTASEIFGLPENMITSELRRRAKAINFGIIYGMGEYTLSRDIGVTRKEAGRYISNYLAAFKGVTRYIEDIISFAREKGYVETIFGRRRYVPEINSAKKQLVGFAERVCRNTPIQGTAADLIKLAMVRVSEALTREGMKTKLILQIHDELILEAPENEVEKASEILRYEMENAFKFKVPIVTDLHCGKTWFDAKE